MIAGRGQVEALVGLELGRDRGEDTFPVHVHWLIPTVHYNYPLRPLRPLR